MFVLSFPTYARPGVGECNIKRRVFCRIWLLYFDFVAERHAKSLGFSPGFQEIRLTTVEDELDVMIWFLFGSSENTRKLSQALQFGSGTGVGLGPSLPKMHPDGGSKIHNIPSNFPMRHFNYLFLVLLAAQRLIASDPLSAASIGVRGPSDAVWHFLRVPVQVELSGGSSGSGFYINVSNTLAFATARHVLFDATGRLHGSNMILLSGDLNSTHTGYCKIEVNLDYCLSNNLLRAHPKHDVAIVRLCQAVDGNLQLSAQSTNFLKISSSGGAKPLAVALPSMTQFADVQVGCDIYVFGYPSSIGLKSSPRFDYSMPLIRKGIIAGRYEKEQTIIIDSSVYFGNSGGPVVQIVPQGMTKWKVGVIGIVTELIPFIETWENKAYRYSNHTLSNSGYSVVEPIDFMLELFKN